MIFKITCHFSTMHIVTHSALSKQQTYSSLHHHHHHIPEGLGVFPVPWSSRWSWSLHLFLGRFMFLHLLVYIVELVLVVCLCPLSVHYSSLNILYHKQKILCTTCICDNENEKLILKYKIVFSPECKFSIY